MTATTRPNVLVLPPEKVDAWRLDRQLLGGTRTDGAGAPGPADVARTLVGVQAQVLSASGLAIALRLRGSRAVPASVDAATRALAERELVRSWAMRGTLHLFAADDFPTVVAALRRKENWRRPAWLRWFGVTEREMEVFIETVGEILDDGRPRSRAELAADLGARMGPRIGELVLGSWGSALKLAANRGYLCQSAGGDDGSVRFVRPSRWLGTWREEDPDEALATLVVRYLAVYGPATRAEMLRWWGMAQVSILRPVMAALGVHLTEVEVGGVRAFIRTEDLAAIQATDPPRSSVRLLGPFDPLIVGAGLRDQLIPPAHLKRVSRTAGWISPVVLVDGRVAGVWTSSRTGNRLRVTVDPFDRPGPAVRRAIGVAAERVAVAHGATAALEFGPAFAVPPASGDED